MCKVISAFAKRFKPVYFLKRNGAKIGEKVFIDKGFKPGSEIDLISIGNNVNISANCRIICHDGSNVVLERLKLSEKGFRKYGTVSIGNNVFVGIDVTFLPNSGVGDNCIVGYGSVVTKSFGNNVVIAGCPAKVICSIEEFTKKNIPLFTKRWKYYS